MGSVGFVSTGSATGRVQRGRTASICGESTRVYSSRREVMYSLGVSLFGMWLAEAEQPEEEKPRRKKPKKGSKAEKSYQLCLSQCIYNCTQPKGALAKERTLCITECKDECATTPEQL